MKSLMAAMLALMVAVPQASAQPLTSEGDHLIRIRLWRSETIAKELTTVPGKQSRDLGAALRQAAREGRLAVHPGTYGFRVEFRNLTADPAPGTMVLVNGQPTPFSNPMDVPVTNGEGRLRISSQWVSESTILILSAPQELGELHYPPPLYRQLRTAPGELARLVGEHEASNYHFVK